MTQSLIIRRDGDQILIQDVLVTTDYNGVLKSTRIDAATAAELFLSGLALAREILREKIDDMLDALKRWGVPLRRHFR